MSHRLEEPVTGHETSQDQLDAIAFLSSSAAHGGERVERIDTHASILFLAGSLAWKLKRDVRYDYLDYSTLEKRRVMCEAELALNQPAAPEIYRRVVPVTRNERGELAIGGSGRPIEWLVEMIRFDQEELFDRLAARDALDAALMPPLAAVIAQLHERAERRTDRGGHDGLAWVIEGNASAFRDEPALGADLTLSSRIIVDARAANERLRQKLDERRRQGFVRRCHGDLHLGNIVRFRGQPTLFDAIEFNEAVSCVDVMYDLAFVLMDLGRLSLWRHANVLLNAYLSDRLDFDGLAPLPLFLALRAAVRAKTVATSAELQRDRKRQEELTAEARSYLALADRLLRPPPACLVAIGGLSGAGKSTLALALASSVGPRPGALVIRSDELRKRLFGVAPLARLGPESYTRAVSARIYDLMTTRTKAVLANNHAAIVDATFANAADRLAIEDAARTAGVPFAGLWLDAPEGQRLDRIRRRWSDPSDADASVVLGQSVDGRVSWPRIDASKPLAVISTEALDLIAPTGATRLN